MKIVSLNINGIRAGKRKGFFEWFEQQNIDILCLQETKAQLSEIGEIDFHIPGYNRVHADAEKKGYSGVAIYYRDSLPYKSHSQILNYNLSDSEGRFIRVDFEGFTVISLYLPSGSSKEARQLEKYKFMDFFENYMQNLYLEYKKNNQAFCICGDWNIVHKEIDIKNFKSNQKNSGCLPEERAWLDKLLTQYGWVDAFRVLNQEPLEYTWWSNRGRARENNVGWRIDYQIITPNLKSKVESVDVYKDSWFSDHAPLIVEYGF